MKDFDFWRDGLGLIELILIYITMCLIVLKVLNMIDWGWNKVLAPASGLLLIIGIILTKWAIQYMRGHHYEK